MENLTPLILIKNSPVPKLLLPGEFLRHRNKDLCPSTWRRQWNPVPILLPGNSHGRRSPVGCGPGGHEESDTTERLHFHFSLSCTGEGNGNPLQCSCLENPTDGGAWWAAVSGVAQSRTRLKRLSSSSSCPCTLGIRRQIPLPLPQTDLQFCLWSFTRVEDSLAVYEVNG